MATSQRRFWRTGLIGLLALATMVWAAVEQFDVPAREMWEHFLGSVLVVVLVILVSGLALALWLGLRRLLRRD